MNSNEQTAAKRLKRTLVSPINNDQSKKQLHNRSDSSIQDYSSEEENDKDKDNIDKMDDLSSSR